MLRHTAAYHVTVVTLAILFLLFPKPILLAMFIIVAVLPSLAGILLKLDTKNIEIDVKAVSSAKVGTPFKLKIEIKHSKHRLISSTAEIIFEFKNQLFKVSGNKKIDISLSSKHEQYIEYVPPYCGELYIHAVSVKCSDIFGFCSLSLDNDIRCRIDIIPDYNEVTILGDQISKARPEVGAFSVSRKGNDSSEVFDLRNYVQGDELKTIHWKLSGKTDQLIVKEYSDSTRYDTIVLYDISLKAEGREIDKQLLTTAVGSVHSLGKALVKAGVPHTAAFVFDGRVISMNISDEKSILDFLYSVISHPLAEENGAACKYLLAGQLEKYYENIIYFTAAAFPSELALIPQDSNLDAVLIKENGTLPSIKQKSELRTFVEVPVDYLRQNKSFNITI